MTMYDRKSPPNGVKMRDVIADFYMIHTNSTEVPKSFKKRANRNNWLSAFLSGSIVGHIEEKPQAPVSPKTTISNKEWIKMLKEVYPNSFYLTDEWRKLKKSVLRMYGLTCMKCGVKNTIMHVDHIKPRSKYPDLSMDIRNLQVLCKSCNIDKGNKHDTDYRTKRHFDLLSQNTKGGH